MGRKGSGPPGCKKLALRRHIKSVAAAETNLNNEQMADLLCSTLPYFYSSTHRDALNNSVSACRNTNTDDVIAIDFEELAQARRKRRRRYKTRDVNGGIQVFSSSASSTSSLDHQSESDEVVDGRREMNEGGRGRGRGRGRGCDETQDNPFTALRSTYPMRGSAALSPQLMADPSLGSSNCLEPILTIPKRGRETAEAELPSSSQPAGGDPVLEHSMEEGTNPTSTERSSPYRLHEMEVDGFRAKLTSRVEGPQQDDNVQPQHQDIDGDVQHQDVNVEVQPPRENSVGPRHEDVLGKIAAMDVPLNSQLLKPSHSLNMTEFAMTQFARAVQHNSDDDPHEVVSAPGLGYECVHGHKVKIEHAGLVGAIFRRYGDITMECDVKSPYFLSFFLERLCVVYQTLEEKTLSNITCTQINGMLEELNLLKTHKVNVEWLLEKLELIFETKSKKYLVVQGESEKLIEANSRIYKHLELRRTHITLLQKKISALDQEMVEDQAMIAELEQKMIDNKAKADECTQMAIAIKTRGRALADQSLVHGLL